MDLLSDVLEIDGLNEGPARWLAGAAEHAAPGNIKFWPTRLDEDGNSSSWKIRFVVPRGTFTKAQVG